MQITSHSVSLHELALQRCRASGCLVSQPIDLVLLELQYQGPIVWPSAGCYAVAADVRLLRQKHISAGVTKKALLAKITQLNSYKNICCMAHYTHHWATARRGPWVHESGKNQQPGRCSPPHQSHPTSTRDGGLHDSALEDTWPWRTSRNAWDQALKARATVFSTLLLLTVRDTLLSTWKGEVQVTAFIWLCTVLCIISWCFTER